MACDSIGATNRLTKMVRVGGYRFPAFTVFISARRKKKQLYIFNINQNLPKKGGHPSQKYHLISFLGIVQNLPKKGGSFSSNIFQKLSPKSRKRWERGTLSKSNDIFQKLSQKRRKRWERGCCLRQSLQYMTSRKTHRLFLLFHLFSSKFQKMHALPKPALPPFPAFLARVSKNVRLLTH